MRVRITRDGKDVEIEVDLAGGTVEIGGARHSFVVVASSPMRVELEIAGERIAIDQWPEGMAAPPGPVDVNGERWALSGVVTSAGRADPAPLPPAPAVRAAPPTAEGPGVPILPPMPGKAIEVRVRDGDHVAKGQILLIFEAMKMRNEIASPIPGTVERLQVRPGSSVRAHEPMLHVVPD